MDQGPFFLLLRAATVAIVGVTQAGPWVSYREVFFERGHQSCLLALLGRTTKLYRPVLKRVPEQQRARGIPHENIN